MKLMFYLLSFCFLCSVATAAFSQDQKPAQAVTYQDIGPIFQSRCVSCHSGPRAANGLHLDSHQGVMEGARNGKVVIPGDAQKERAC